MATFLCNLPPSSAKFELAECCGIKWIGGEPIAPRDRMDLFKSLLRTIALRDRARISTNVESVGQSDARGGLYSQ